MTNSALLRLLTWLSPAFPTGGFAYSHGLEWSVEAGDVTDEASLITWIEDTLSHGALWSDAILLRHAYRAPDDLAPLVELATALSPAPERRLETLAQGAAFCAAAAPWAALGPLPYPVAVGALAAAHAVPEDDAALAYLHAAAANMVSAALRLIPLGQAAGLRAQAALEPAILATAALTASATLDDLGTANWRAEIAAMHHETQYTRLFRT
jgi:urease accessory protein